MHIIFCEEGDYFSDYTLRKMTDDLNLVQDYIEGKEEIRTSSVTFVRILTENSNDRKSLTLDVGIGHFFVF